MRKRYRRKTLVTPVATSLQISTHPPDRQSKETQKELLSTFVDSQWFYKRHPRQGSKPKTRATKTQGQTGVVSKSDVKSDAAPPGIAEHSGTHATKVSHRLPEHLLALKDISLSCLDADGRETVVNVELPGGIGFEQGRDRVDETAQLLAAIRNALLDCARILKELKTSSKEGLPIGKHLNELDATLHGLSAFVSQVHALD